MGGKAQTAAIVHDDSVKVVPPVQYLRHATGAIAYQIWGLDQPDLLLMTDMTTSVDNIWEHPGRLRFLSSYGELGRVIRFDPRGQGASDPLPLDEVGQIDAWLDDALHILDALDVAAAVVSAEGFASHAGMRLAAEHPDRVLRLALFNPFARMASAEDYPIGQGHERDAPVLADLVRTKWGTGELTAESVPGLATGAPDAGFIGRTERLGASPAVAGALMAAAHRSDVRAVLPAISVPTFVVHTGDVLLIPVELSRYVADHIPGARFSEVPSISLFWGASGLGPLAEFLAGTAAESKERVIRSVLFTDVVDSTRMAAELGDLQWEQRLTHLDEFVAVEAARFGGRIVKQTGDGHLVSFPTPGAAIQAALRILRAAPTLHVDLRAGIHTGEIEERSDGDIAGIAVHVAARVASCASSRQLLVSRTVADLVSGGEFELEDQGQHELKGLSGSWTLYSVDPD